MEAILIHPENEEQLKAVKSVLKALKVPFEKQTLPYNPDFVEKIRQSEQEIKEGKVTRVTKENQKAFLGL